MSFSSLAFVLFVVIFLVSLDMFLVLEAGLLLGFFCILVCRLQVCLSMVNRFVVVFWTDRLALGYAGLQVCNAGF